MGSSERPPVLAKDPLVYRTDRGSFWHLRSAKRSNGYVLTVCGRRLGTWHVLPPRRLSKVAPSLICVGCLRKAPIGEV